MIIQISFIDCAPGSAHGDSPSSPPRHGRSRSLSFETGGPVKVPFDDGEHEYNGWFNLDSHADIYRVELTIRERRLIICCVRFGSKDHMRRLYEVLDRENNERTEENKLEELRLVEVRIRMFNNPRIIPPALALVLVPHPNNTEEELIDLLKHIN